MESGTSQADPFTDLVRMIVAGNCAEACESVDASPQLASAWAPVGASRQRAKDHFFDEIAHYMYEGDTALHMVAAACQTRIVDKLIKMGADVRARNRRGAEPPHYAVDGGPGSPGWDPDAQITIIAALVQAGADPNTVDKSGVAPLHRAVRNRCAAAVRALIDAGADPRARNGSGSTPLTLATQNTGRSGSGSAEAKAQQREILLLLERHATE